MNNNDIDIVITWVDGNDPEWQEDFNLYSPHKRELARFQDLGTLRYLFRGIEACLPWYRKIHLITYGHLPNWLDINFSRLNIVTHEQIMPTSCLPTFNSQAIEMAFGNIPDLADKFIYFNDDMFVLEPMAKTSFFHKGRPVENIRLCSLNEISLNSHAIHEMSKIIIKELKNKGLLHRIQLFTSTNFSLKRNLNNLLHILMNAINTIDCNHFPQPLLKKSIQDVYHDFPNEVQETMKRKFRSPIDFNQWAYRFMGISRGDIYHGNNSVKNLFILFQSAADLSQKLKTLNREHIAMLCLGEHGDNVFPEADYPLVRTLLSDFFEAIFPQKSSFEL